ncbi:MAG: hypothetical protein KatS3mg128_1304 [Silanimonas sp.]|nr:MAG: hypothetical protein KatS3mg128_1304 [Silanimonas sp.]
MPSLALNVRCERCEHAGFERVAAGLGPGQHVVFSLHQGLVFGFSVERERELERSDPRQPRTPVLFAYPRELAADERAQFEAALQLYRETGGTMKWEVVVPIRDIPLPQPLNFSGMSAYQFANSMGNWHHVAHGVVQWARTARPLGQAGQWWQVLGSIVGAAGTQLEVTVVFADGGRATYLVDYGTETFAERQGPIRDADGNIIPTLTDSPGVQNGIVTFSSPLSLSRMNEHLASIGSPLRFAELPAGCRPPGPLVYQCAWGPGMITYTCRRLGTSGC